MMLSEPNVRLLRLRQDGERLVSANTLRSRPMALGVQPVAIPVGPETRWAPTPELLDAAGAGR